MKTYWREIVFIGVVFYKIIGCVGEKIFVYNRSSIALEKCDSQPDYYKCFDGTCIHITKYCDGVIHCKGTAEDERDCIRCPPGLCIDFDGSCSIKSNELGEKMTFFSDFLKFNCISSTEVQKPNYFDCTNVGLAYLPCLFESPDTLILDKNKLGTFNSLSDSTFLKYSQLEVLTLAENEITYLPPNVFRELRNLTRLTLRRNQIQSLNENIFENLHNLQYLYLSFNKIAYLSPEIFRNLRNLMELSLSFNQIEHLDESILRNQLQLQCLYLNDNKITKLPPKVFRSLENLRRLYLQYNDIRYLDEKIFKNLYHLEWLSLSNNRITTLNEYIFEDLHNLNTLYFNDNNIADLPTNIFRNSQNLTLLSLENNRIHYLEKTVFQNLTNLWILNLKYNKISCLSGNVFRDLKNLGDLYLTSNGISYIHEAAFQSLFRLKFLELEDNRLSNLPVKVFQNLRNLKSLRLPKNKIQQLNESVFGNLTSLMSLYLYENNIAILTSNVLGNLKNLTRLRDLRGNNIAYLPSNVFRELKNLHYLNLEENRIEYLHEAVFRNQPQLYTLNLSCNQITELPPRMLENSRFLKILDLGNNAIEVVDELSFSSLFKLSVLNLKNNQIGDVSAYIFKDLHTLKSLKADEFRFCCMKKEIEECEAPSNEFSSCDDLLKDVSLRIFIWILGIIAIFANIFVIYVRIKYQNAKTNKVNLFLIVNLAISDLVMGVYLLMIAIIDAGYRGEYYVHDLHWRRSYWCDMAGVLSTFSSELTVLILTVISVDRLIAITFPFRTMQRGSSGTKILVGLVWGFAAIISLVPHQFFGILYFKNFYSRSGVCLALHITNETPDGWEYSVFVFIILNAIFFVVIALSYLLMYYQASRRKRGTITSSNQSSDTVMAVRMTLLVLADAACWIPIIVLGIRSLMGYALPPDVYPWIAVFVLPLNAAMNPILYTISSIPMVIGVKFEKSAVDGQPYFKCFWRGLQLNAV